MQTPKNLYVPKDQRQAPHSSTGQKHNIVSVWASEYGLWYDELGGLNIPFPMHFLLSLRNSNEDLAWI